MSQKVISDYLQARDRGERVLAPRVKLTLALIENLPVKSYDYAIGEATVPGLSVRVRRGTGHKTFEVVRKVNGRTARSKVCAFGERPYARGDACVLVEARNILAKMDKGITRSKEKAAARVAAADEARKALTVKDACDNYISAKNRAKNTTQGYQRFRDKHLKCWHHRQLASIREDEIAERFDHLTDEFGPVAANNVLRFFRAVWKHHRRRYELGEPPTVIFTQEGDSVKAWNPEVRRSRYIHRNELKAWWEATERLRTSYAGDGDLAADYLQFGLLTGLRRRELTQLRWEDVNRRRRTLLIADNKSKRPHTVVLTEHLESILDRRSGGSGPFEIEEVKAFVRKVSAWSGVPFSSHDLRRTYLSHATAVGIPGTIQKGLVNHSRKGVTDGYIQIDEELLRDSAERVQSYILTHAGVVNNVAQMVGRDSGLKEIG